MWPLPNRSRKSVLFVTELLQRLGNRHVNARQPRRKRSQQSKIDNRRRAGLHQGFSRDTCSTRFSARTTSWATDDVVDFHWGRSYKNGAASCKPRRAQERSRAVFKLPTAQSPI